VRTSTTRTEQNLEQLKSVLARKLYKLSSEHLMYDFVELVRDRLSSCTFEDESARRYWRRIHPDAKAALDRLAQLGSRLSVNTHDEFERFRDSVQRAWRGLELARANELEYAEWLVFSTETLAELLYSRKLLKVTANTDTPSTWTDEWGTLRRFGDAEAHSFFAYRDVEKRRASSTFPYRASVSAEALNLVRETTYL
jgi:hypothetical protein